jgi:hypothetical protein
MASLTTNPSPHIVNIFPFPNIITSAAGNSAATDSVYIAELRNYVNTSNRSIKVNTLSAYSGSNVTVNNNLLLSNAALQINNTSRFNATGLGIGTTNPTANLDVVGTALVRGPLTVNGILNASTLGVGTTNPTAPLDVAGSAVIQASLTVGDLLTANALGIGTMIPLAQLDVNGATLLRSQLNVSSSIYASGNMYAPGFITPSDARLKRDVEPYRAGGQIDPVRFTWAATGLPDIGVLAQDVWKVEPACVHSTSAGTLGVDYAKLVVVCLAEIQELKTEVRGLQSTLKELCLSNK